MEHEPGVRRALADPAVGDDRLAVRDHALAPVELPQLVGRLEGAVLVDRLRPRHRGGARDVPGALGALLLVAGHRDQLAGELLRAADVDQVASPLSSASRTSSRFARIDSSPGFASNVGLRIRRHLGRRLAALGDPLLARAVDQLDVVVAVVAEVPVGVGGEPVVAVAVEDDRVVVGDPAAAHQLAEVLRARGSRA